MATGESVWWYVKEGEKYGPLSAPELKQNAISGNLAPTDLIWKEGFPDWVPASSAKGLFPPPQNSSPPPVPVAKKDPPTFSPSAPVLDKVAENGPANISKQATQANQFCPEDNEKIFLEGRATYLKSMMKVVSGYAYITSKRVVFCSSGTTMSNVIMTTSSDILFSIPLTNISAVKEGKHGLAKKCIITTSNGDEYSIAFEPHDKWFNIIKDPQKMMKTADENEKTIYNEGDDGKLWYYEESGKRIGPIPSSKMKQWVRSNHTIYRFTKVWQEGSKRDWCKAEETELGEYFDGPPPLTGDNVSNTIVWVLAFAPIFGSIIVEILNTLFSTNRFWPVSFAIIIVLALLDERKLNAAGHNTRALGLGSAWLVPVYLYKRAKHLKQSKAYFVVWIITFLINLFLDLVV